MTLAALSVAFPSPFAGSLDPPVTDQADEVEWVWDLYLYIGYGVLALVVGLVLFLARRRHLNADALADLEHEIS